MQQQQPDHRAVVQPPIESTTVADVLIGAIGLTGLLVLVAVLLGGAFGGLLIGIKMLRRRTNIEPVRLRHHSHCLITPRGFAWTRYTLDREDRHDRDSARVGSLAHSSPIDSRNRTLASESDHARPRPLERLLVAQHRVEQRLRNLLAVGACSSAAVLPACG